jgi:hypothetical protein
VGELSRYLNRISKIRGYKVSWRIVFTFVIGMLGSGLSSCKNSKLSRQENLNTEVASKNQGEDKPISLSLKFGDEILDPSESELINYAVLSGAQRNQEPLEFLQWHLHDWQNTNFERFPFELNQLNPVVRFAEYTQKPLGFVRKIWKQIPSESKPEICKGKLPLTYFSKTTHFKNLIDNPFQDEKLISNNLDFQMKQNEINNLYVIDGKADASHIDLKNVFSQPFDSFQNVSSHGTHIAGILSAIRNDVGVRGLRFQRCIQN